MAALASGSNGNAYFIQNASDAVLVDAGVSSRELLMRMESLGISPSMLSGICITHEHADHVRGLAVFLKKHPIPVYMTQGTRNGLAFDIPQELVKIIKQDSEFDIGSLHIHSFAKAHDAAEPVSFTIESGKKRIAVITDAGHSCKNIIQHVKHSHGLFLESNYDEHMLSNGLYPAYLKQRVASDQGHLSNMQCALLTMEHASPLLQAIVLSHISQNNNTPELAKKTFDYFIKERKDLQPQICTASRFNHTELFMIK